MILSQTPESLLFLVSPFETPDEWDLPEKPVKEIT